MVVSRTLFNISKDFVGTDDLPEFQRSIRIARSDVVSVGSELPSNNYGKSPLIISCKNTSAQRASEASLLRDGRVNLPLCDGTLGQPTHILVSDVTQHSQAIFVLPNSSAPPASALLTIELTKSA